MSSPYKQKGRATGAAVAERRFKCADADEAFKYRDDIDRYSALEYVVRAISGKYISSYPAAQTSGIHCLRLARP